MYKMKAAAIHVVKLFWHCNNYYEQVYKKIMAAVIHGVTVMMYVQNKKE